MPHLDRERRAGEELGEASRASTAPRDLAQPGADLRVLDEEEAVQRELVRRECQLGTKALREGVPACAAEEARVRTSVAEASRDARALRSSGPIGQSRGGGAE